MDLELSGRVALITGGSKGIGRGIATSLAREGAFVAICARRQRDLAEAVDAIRRESGNEQVIGVPADVTNPEDIERFIEAARDRFSRIDILVNNAGGSAARPFERVSDEDFEADLALKLMAAIRTSRLAVPHMRAGGYGRIINITAIQGKHPGPSTMPTAISRAAGIAFTKALSKDLAKDGILVNTICIGLIRSEQIERAAGARFEDLPLDDALARMGEVVPLGRIGRPEEVGDLVAFLASPRGSYITGVAINADGGLSSSV
jgi:NAD(P)-dependent dehydrogenase (short-subunit alcohol dehydrogenase family)